MSNIAVHKSYGKKMRMLKIVLHTILVIFCLISVYPVFVMISGSFKSMAELMNNAASLPKEFTLDNYTRLLGYNSDVIARTFMNSLFVASTTTVLQLLLASMAGFAFSKYKFRGKNLLFMMFMMTMMVPGELLLTPQFLIFSIPNELIEAARIDGAGHTRIYRQIILPTSVPTIGALAILQFLAKWNDFLYPKIMITKVDYKPIMVILPTLTVGGDTAGTPYDLVLAGCTLVTVPMIITFLCLQDKFLQSVTLGSVKG